MYGDLANKLILDAKRSNNLDEVLLYQHDLVKDIIKEINDLNQDCQFINEEQRLNNEINDENSEQQNKINQCQLFVTHLCMRRNKRCLLTYQYLRSIKMNQFIWLNIDGINSSSSLLNINNLNHAEQEYINQYQDLVVNYKSNFPDLDLLGDLSPPENIFIDVRVLKDGGEVQTEYGMFNLIKDSQFYVRKSDVERLIQQGYLEVI